MRKYVLIMCLVLFALIPSIALSEYVIIVIDTSLSMNRKVIDSQRLYDIALKSLSNAIYSLSRGDIVYIADFNEKTYIRSPIEIKDEHTKEVIVKIMYGVQPYGKWTYTYQMLKDISFLVKTNNLPPDKSKIIIISDGIDDPPVKTKTYLMELEKVSSMFEPSQLVYYISLENLVKSSGGEKSSIKEKISKNSNISVVEVEKPEEVTKKVEEKLKGGINLKTEIALVTLLLLILVVFALLNMSAVVLSKKKSKISKVVCTSERGKRSFIIPSFKKKIVISKEKGDIKLKDWNYDGDINIKTSFSGYKIFVTDTSKVISPFKNGEVINKGYKVVVSNYTFEFE